MANCPDVASTWMAEAHRFVGRCASRTNNAIDVILAGGHRRRHADRFTGHGGSKRAKTASRDRQHRLEIGDFVVEQRPPNRGLGQVKRSKVVESQVAAASLGQRAKKTSRRESRVARSEAVEKKSAVRHAKPQSVDKRSAVRHARTESVDEKNAVRHAVGLRRRAKDQGEVTLDDLDPFDDTAIRNRVVTPEPIAEEIGKQIDALPQDPALQVPLDAFDEDEPSLEELAQRPGLREEECPLPSDLKPITEVTDDISAEGVEFPPECTLGDAPYIPRQFAMTTYTWKASGSATSRSTSSKSALSVTVTRSDRSCSRSSPGRTSSPPSQSCPTRWGSSHPANASTRWVTIARQLRSQDDLAIGTQPPRRDWHKPASRRDSFS